VIAAPGPQHRVRRIPLESAAVQAMINTLELFMQLAAGMWPTIQLPAPPPLLRLRPRWGHPLQSALAGWISGTAEPAPRSAESVNRALVTKLLTIPLAESRSAADADDPIASLRSGHQTCRLSMAWMKSGFESLGSIFAQGADLLPPAFKIMFRQDSVTR
jgi:hypothetical protein